MGMAGCGFTRWKEHAHLLGSNNDGSSDGCAGLLGHTAEGSARWFHLGMAMGTADGDPRGERLVRVPSQNQLAMSGVAQQMDGRKMRNLDSWLSDASQPFNIYAHHSAILKAILCAGLYPNVAAGEQGIVASALSGLKRSFNSANTGRAVWFDGRREVHIHPSSVNSNSKAFQYPFLVFLEKVETNKVFLRDTSVISPYSILLFGGSIIVQHQCGVVMIDGWLKLSAPAQIAVLFKELRLTLHSILKELIRKPENSMALNNEIIKSIITLLLEEGNMPK
ncbi:hypothetical protein RIF29_08310 [Crotalaria pallida]|uniref:Uncharacterized protein n=1 Tax=Crotalaria pallida TaxID=3830 RepID=A0AAN9J728_CROPI